MVKHNRKREMEFLAKRKITTTKKPTYYKRKLRKMQNELNVMVGFLHKTIVNGLDKNNRKYVPLINHADKTSNQLIV